MKFQDYNSTLDYLYQTLPIFQRVGAAALKNDLTNTIKLCAALDNPHRKFKSIHVAGTNGKGSTSHMLAAILQSAGYKTGLYTSPHLKEFTERIKINGKEVGRDFVVDFVNKLHLVMENIQPSFFEMTVAMAFDYFAKEKVDIAVIEVGLGGRLDSTNVITPELSIITNISYDHKDLLGDTLAKIAAEKAGIIKRTIPVLISERQPEVEQVFIQRAEQLKAPITFATDQVQLTEISRQHVNTLTRQHVYDISFHGKPWLTNLHPDLQGNYQQKNLPGVLTAILHLRANGFSIPDEAVIKGISAAATITGLKGRWQVLSHSPLTICDTAHNPAGIEQVVEQISDTPYRHLHFVFGVVKEKDLAEVLQLLPKDASYYFCQSKIPRALDAGDLEKAAAAQGLSGKVIRDVNEAYREALAHAQEGDLVFIGGSTFVVAEIEGL